MKTLFLRIQRNVFNNRFKNFKAPSIEFPKFDPEVFADISNRKINRFQNAFKNLQQDEPLIQHVGVSSYDNTLIVQIENLGEYKVWADLENSLLYLFSPHTGNFSYYFDESENLWISTKDKHILDEHLVRELLKFTRGYLDI